MKRIARNLFERGGWYYFRWKADGESRRISLLTKDIKDARAQARELRNQLAQAAFNRAPAAFRFDTVTKVLAYYLDADCPTRAGKKRIGKQLSEEQKRIEHLSNHIGGRDPEKLTASDWQDYIQLRSPSFKRGDGGRVLDLEWVAFNNAFRICAKHPKETGILEVPSSLTIPGASPPIERKARAFILRPSSGPSNELLRNLTCRSGPLMGSGVATSMSFGTKTRRYQALRLP